jgi:hypothetical protein
MLTQIRIGNNSQDPLTAHLQGNGDREERESMSEVGCPIERVDKPHSRCITGVLPSLLGQDAILRETAADDIHNHSFRFKVRFRDEVNFSFLGNVIDPAETGSQYHTRFPRSLTSDVQFSIPHLKTSGRLLKNAHLLRCPHPSPC